MRPGFILIVVIALAVAGFYGYDYLTNQAPQIEEAQPGDHKVDESPQKIGNNPEPQDGEPFEFDPDEEDPKPEICDPIRGDGSDEKPKPEICDPFIGKKEQKLSKDQVRKNSLNIITQKFVNNNNQFAYEIYRKVREKKKGENIFISPYSISTAIAMAYEGARGNTRTEMNNVMHYGDVNVPISFNALQNLLNVTPGVQLNSACSTWPQKGYEFLDSYLDTMNKYYGGIHVADFKNALEPSRIEINQWVSDRTNKMIPELIKKDVMDKSTRLVLVNAIYFKGIWNLPFDSANTVSADFYQNKTQSVKAKMMTMTEHPGNKINRDKEDYYPKALKVPYHENRKTGDKAIRLAYEGRKVAMTFILPGKNRTVEDVEDSYLSVEGYENLWLSNREMAKIQIPKFDIGSEFELSPALIDMGMRTAFSRAADFSGIDGSQRLKIGSVIHEAKCKTDEIGSEASAATAVIMVEKTSIGGHREPAVFVADRPFVLIIEDRQTDSILFMGRVINPGN